MACRGSVSTILVAVTGALILATSPRPAHAYLDPATGSLVLQVVVAAPAAAAVGIRAF